MTRPREFDESLPRGTARSINRPPRAHAGESVGSLGAASSRPILSCFAVIN